MSQRKNLNVIPGSVEVAGKCLVWSWLSKAPSVTGWQMGARVKGAQGDQKEGLPQRISLGPASDPGGPRLAPRLERGAPPGPGLALGQTHPPGQRSRR